MVACAIPATAFQKDLPTSLCSGLDTNGPSHGISSVLCQQRWLLQENLECCPTRLTDLMCLPQEVQPWDQREGAEVALSKG